MLLSNKYLFLKIFVLTTAFSLLCWDAQIFHKENSPDIEEYILHPNKHDNSPIKMYLGRVSAVYDNGYELSYNTVKVRAFDNKKPDIGDRITLRGKFESPSIIRVDESAIISNFSRKNILIIIISLFALLLFILDLRKAFRFEFFKFVKK